MPEVITKYPDAVLTVLKGAGANCDPGQRPDILSGCATGRLCKTPSGELCIYTPAEANKLTQLTASDRELLCAHDKGSGCTLAVADTAAIPGASLGAVCLITLLTIGAWRVRSRWRRHRPG